MQTEPIFQLCWLRESSSGHLDFDSGSSVPASLLELALLGLTPGGAGESTAANELPVAHKLEVHHIQAALESPGRVNSLPKWLKWRLAAFFGRLNTEARVRDAKTNFETVRAMCGRIRQVNAGRPWSEVHLPYFTRREWNRRFEAFRNLNFEQRHGWIQASGADPHSLDSLALRTAAFVFQPRPGPGLPLRFLFPDCRLEQPWAGLLADRWGVKLPVHSAVRSLELSLPGQAAEAWRRAPRLHHGRYHQVFIRVALSLQWILRRWSLAQHASTLEGLRDVEATLQLTMFNTLRPWAEGARSEPCYDVLDESLMLESFRKAGRRLPAHMEMAAEWCDRHGFDDLAREYRSPRMHIVAARVADRCFRGRAVRNMLSAESGVINAIVRFSQEARTAEAPRAIRSAVDALAASFDEYLPRIFRGPGAAKKIAPAIFLEATSALSAALGNPPPLDVRMETEDGAVHRNQPSAVAA
jgi:hypothetical protein